MESDKANDEDKPSASVCPLEDSDGFAITGGQDEAADCSGIFHNSNNARADLVSFPCLSLPVAPQDNVNGTYHSYTHDFLETGGNRTADFTKLSRLQNPQIDQNPINIRSNMPRFLRVSDVLSPEANLSGIHQSMNHDKMVTPDNVINDGSCFSFQNSQINRNFMPTRVNAAGGSQITRQRGEAKSSNVNRSEINGNFVSLGCSAPMLYHTQNNTDNDIMVNAVHFHSPENIDGSFLTLGFGGNTESRSKANKLEEAISPQFSTLHAQQTTRNSSSRLGHNLADGFSNSIDKVDGWTSCNRDVGVIHGTNTGLSSSPFGISQTPQTYGQHNFSIPSNRSPSSLGQRDARFADFDPYRGSQVYPAPASLQFSNSSAGFSRPGQTGSFRLASESAKPTWINTQPTSDHVQKCYMKTGRTFSPESSMNSPFYRPRGSSFMQDHSGQLFSNQESNAAQTARDSLYPKMIEAQVDKVSAAQVASGGPFPKRLGIQLSENNAAQAVRGGNLFRTQGTGSPQFPKNLIGPPFATGKLPQNRVPALSVDSHGPYSATGQLQGRAAVQFSNYHLRPVSTTGQVIPDAEVNRQSRTSNVFGRPYLKRGAVQPPPATHWVQRRKMTPTPTIYPSMPRPLQTAPVPVSTPAPALPRIKWQGFDRHGPPPQLTGQKCLLCKRDLSFSPEEGPVSQPTIAPVVAVLPCGHTFHDHCLQIITPEDQAKNPPCIPCAIGET